MQKKMITFIITLSMLSPMFAFGSINIPDELERVDQVLEKGVENIYRDQKVKDGLPYWNYGYYLGSFHTSIYLLYYFYFYGINNDGIPNNLEHFRKILKSEQYPDGSWKDFRDHNFDSGILDATILNYFVLKLMGEPVDSDMMTKARKYVLDRGGVEASTFLSKFTLAVFNNYPWEKVPSIPDVLLNNVKLENFAQWIAPNFYPVFYMRKQQMTASSFKIPEFMAKGQTVLEQASRFDISELFFKRPVAKHAGKVKKALDSKGYYSKKLKMDKADRKVLTYFLRPEGQLPHGSWGAYGPATAMGVLILKDLLKQMGNKSEIRISKGLVVDRELIEQKIKKGLDYLAKMSTDAQYGNYHGLQSYGNFWDTALITNALLEVARTNDLQNPGQNILKFEQQKLRKVGDYLLMAQGPDGGFAFGHDFQTMTDADDSAEIILAFAKLGPLGRKQENNKYREAVKRSFMWLAQLRSDDLGMPAFESRASRKHPLAFIFRLFAPHGFIFDPSSADVSGHVLEAIGAMFDSYSDGKFVPDLINSPSHLPRLGHDLVQYLENTVIRDGDKVMWEGRWGVNYLYGTSAALNGLFKIKAYPQKLLALDDNPRLLDLGHTVMQSLKWIQNCQNKDGGYGETTESYDHIELACKGVSTPSQTSWALLAMASARIKGDSALDKAIQRAAGYLINEMNSKGEWTDNSAVGTGFPGFLYMKYLSYPKAFPMMALAKYKEWLLERARAGIDDDKSSRRETLQETFKYRKPVYDKPFGLNDCTPPKDENNDFDQTVEYFQCVSDRLQCKSNGKTAYLENLMFKTMDAERDRDFSTNARKWFNRVNIAFAKKLDAKFMELGRDNPLIGLGKVCRAVQKTLFKAHGEVFSRYGFCNGARKEKLVGNIYDGQAITLEKGDYKKWLKLIGKTFFTTNPAQTLSKEALKSGREMAEFIFCALLPLID